MPNTQSGILLESKTPLTAREIEISTDTWDSYRIEFYLGSNHIDGISLPKVEQGGGTFKRRVQLPDSLIGKQFNQILVKPVEGDNFYSLAYLILDPS